MRTDRPRSSVAAALAPLDRPLTSYYLILGSTGLLLAIGLVMVLSTSSAIELGAGQSPYSAFTKQLLGAAVAVALMWVLSRMPPGFFRFVAYPMLLAALASLALVLAFGTSAGGAERWISIAGTQVQPSEFAKLAFLIWGADLLARKERLGQLNDWRTLLIPLLPAAATICMLVMLGNDLGTTFLLLVIMLGLLWVVGVPARIFLAILGLILFALLVLVVVGNYGGGRISGFLNPTAGGPTGPNMQTIQGTRAIGSGGFFGVGLGNSREKWGWVPDSNTDFIFAILGEELGLVGTSCVVLLYGALAYAGLRVARRVGDPFMRFAAGGAVAWIVGEALVNICAVVGLLPITGVPLPLISQGLSSVLATMAAIGMLLSFARREPGAAEALAATDRRFRLGIPAAWRREDSARRVTPQGSAVKADPARIRRSASRSASPSSTGGHQPHVLPVSGNAGPGRKTKQERSRLTDSGKRPAPGPAGRSDQSGQARPTAARKEAWSRRPGSAGPWPRSAE